jgi:hypothetical protein
LDQADARVQPILRSRWLRNLIEGDGVATIEVTPEGSATDHPLLRGYVSSVVSAEDYDRLKPQLEQGLAFTLRERSRPDGRARISEWVVLPDRSLLLVTFAGDGVLQWTPAELGFRGEPSQLKGLNAVAVRLTPEGQIDPVVP